MFYTLTTKDQNEKTQNFITMTSKRTKYLGIYWSKEAKDLYSAKYRILIKEIKTTETDGKIWCSGLEDSLQSFSNYKCHFFHRINKTVTICMETRKTMNSQSKRKLKESEREKQILCFLNVECRKMIQMNLLAKQKLRHRHPEWISGCQWRKRGGINWENGINI